MVLNEMVIYGNLSITSADFLSDEVTTHHSLTNSNTEVISCVVQNVYKYEGRFCNWGDNLLGNEIGGVTISWFEKGRVTNLFWFEFGRVTVPRSKMGG